MITLKINQNQMAAMALMATLQERIGVHAQHEREMELVSEVFYIDDDGTGGFMIHCPQTDRSARFYGGTDNDCLYGIDMGYYSFMANKPRVKGISDWDTLSNRAWWGIVTVNSSDTKHLVDIAYHWLLD